MNNYIQNCTQVSTYGTSPTDTAICTQWTVQNVGTSTVEQVGAYPDMVALNFGFIEALIVFFGLIFYFKRR